MVLVRLLFQTSMTASNKAFKLLKTNLVLGQVITPLFILAIFLCLHFFTGQHEDYHKPSDDTEKLNYEGMETISDYIFDIITDLDDNGELAFRKTKNESEDDAAI